MRDLIHSVPKYARGLVAGLALLPGAASAQLVEVTTLNPATSIFYDDLERAAAAANEAVFFALDPLCSGGISPSCNAEQLGVYDESVELIDTALEILFPGTNPPNSLQLDNEGLGDALRWTAAEEASAKSRAATDFSNGQVASANNRITALRYGARGFTIAGVPGMPSARVPGVRHEDTLGPAGDDPSTTLPKWGGFVNGSYSWGEHDPTTFEDAFDFEGVDITGGVDYRILPNVALGVVGGYSENEIDFDETKSIVDGGIDSEGFSVGAFGLYTWKDLYLSGFFSYQRMSFDIDRFITYPSFNPNVPGANTTTKGDTDSDAFTVAGNVGYTYRFGFDLFEWTRGTPFLLEPSARIEYTDMTIDGYTEDNVEAGETFALAVDEQDVDSLEVTLGLRASVAVSTPLGVIFPYARGEWRFELEDDTRDTTSQYAVPGLSSALPFVLDSEEIDDNYGSITGGLQTIVPTARLFGRGAGYLSIFGEYRTVVALDNIENEVISGGIRLVF